VRRTDWLIFSCVEVGDTHPTLLRLSLATEYHSWRLTYE
jgi:hypothetical protein